MHLLNLLHYIVLASDPFLGIGLPNSSPTFLFQRYLPHAYTPLYFLSHSPTSFLVYPFSSCYHMVFIRLLYWPIFHFPPLSDDPRIWIFSFSPCNLHLRHLFFSYLFISSLVYSSYSCYISLHSSSCFLNAIYLFPSKGPYFRPEVSTGITQLTKILAFASQLSLLLNILRIDQNLSLIHISEPTRPY